MPVRVLTDHKGLEYFMTTKKLTPRQARWAEFLSEFNFVVTYQSGKKNNKADALTPRPNERPISDEDERQEHRMQVLLPLNCIEIQPIKVTNKTEEEAEELRRSHAAVPYAEPQPTEENVKDKGVAATRDERIEFEREEGVEAKRREVELEDLPTLPN